MTNSIRLLKLFAAAVSGHRIPCQERDFPVVTTLLLEAEAGSALHGFHRGAMRHGGSLPDNDVLLRYTATRADGGRYRIAGARLVTAARGDYWLEEAPLHGMHTASETVDILRSLASRNHVRGDAALCDVRRFRKALGSSYEQTSYRGLPLHDMAVRSRQGGQRAPDLELI